MHHVSSTSDRRYCYPSCLLVSLFINVRWGKYLGYNGPPVGNGIWRIEWSRDWKARWRPGGGLHSAGEISSLICELNSDSVVFWFKVPNSSSFDDCSSSCCRVCIFYSSFSLARHHRHMPVPLSEQPAPRRSISSVWYRHRFYNLPVWYSGEWNATSWGPRCAEGRGGS